MPSSNHQRSSEDSPSDDPKLEKGQGAQQGAPAPVGFFNPALDRVRKEVFVLWVRTSKSSPNDIPVYCEADVSAAALILSIFILTVLSLCKLCAIYRVLGQH